MTRPTLRRLRLVRPVLRLALPSRPAVARPAPRARGPRLASVEASGAASLEIEDGKLQVGIDLLGRPLSVSSHGVYLRPAGDGARTRLVLGRTRVVRDGVTLVDVGATGVDLDPRHGYRPERAAALAGALGLPGATGSGVALHQLGLERQLDEYALRIDGKTDARHAGRFEVRARLDRAFRPVSASVKLYNLDLGPLASLLEPAGILVEGTRLGGSVELAREGEGHQLRTLLEVRHLQLRHGLVAAQVVGPFDAQLRATVDLRPRRSEVELRELRLVSGALVVDLAGVARAGASHATLALDLGVPTTSCQALLSSVPYGFAPSLEGLALDGQLGIHGKLRVDTRDLERTEVALDFKPLTCRVLADPPLADAHRLEREIAITVSGPRGSGMRWALGPSNPHWRPLSRISRHLKNAFIVAEDTRFFEHEGFDEAQLKRAFVANLKEGRLLRGASTISQQLVKNVFLDHGRTLSRKVQETVLTWRLEQLVSKRRILELYLNLVEMGPEVYGVGQAAEHYFGRSADSLTPLQAAHLAALTPSPRQLGARFRSGESSTAWTEKLRMLLRMMRHRGSISRDEQRYWGGVGLSLLRRD